MHEFSIANALLQLVARHTPAGMVVKTVVIESGPLQGIDPEAMRWAWQAASAGGPCEGSELQVTQLPWQLRCEACGKEWSADELELECSCGAKGPHPVGGDELRLRSLTVDDNT